MAEILTKVSGEEFIVKLLGGERDFSKIFLEERFDLSGHGSFQELKTYLKTQDLQKTPVDISNSQFRYLRARELYLPFTVGRNVNLRGANFESAKFDGANFESANLGNVNFKGANLKDACFVNADLWIANFRSANLEGANFEGAYLKGSYFGGANFKNVRNLTEVVNLGKEYLLEKK
ncbi:pentapeptide repeat-containing protein [Candidatus Pacearchaeota archaeon]|nr:pentapeptide repeat-containing protein [Candidatus Pacearchaeota archaeon]MBI2057062.1 pentapeptide repeat-containing protein [Candidatus Pacearchaeota archaeon]